jgi:hypothetical protein
VIDAMKNDLKYLAEPDMSNTDLCLRSIIEDCLDYKDQNAMADKANKILAFIFEGDPNEYERHMLMGLFTKVINMDQPLKQYSKFFTSNLINEKPTTCFAEEI